MTYPNQKGSALVAGLIIAIVFFIMIGVFFLVLGNERARTRDAQRLADIARIQAAFELLYNDQASYEMAAENGCNEKGMSVSRCNLTDYIETIRELTDPGKYSYTISDVPTLESYGVRFHLEKGYGSLSAGRHTLGPDGIK